MKIIINILMITSLILSRGITIYSTAEIHGALKYGEVTKSSGVWGVEEILSDRGVNSIVLDAGGFMAGGIYDAIGRDYKNDSLRSIDLWKKMAEINYSAITLGDDDLRFSSSFLSELNSKWPLPLVSANVSVSSLNIERVKKVVVGKDTVYITGLTTTKNIYIRDSSIAVTDPIDALKRLTDSLGNREVIVLAHLLPKTVERIASSFPTVKLIIRGHKRDTVEKIGNSNIVPFGFEGSSVAVTNLKRGEFYRENSLLPPRGEERDRVKPASTRLDLYIMSGCPYGIDALKSAIKVKNRLNNIDLNVWFIGDKIEENGKVRLIPSLKSGKLRDEMIYIAVKEVYGYLYEDFIWLVTENRFTPDSAISELGIDTVKINRWIERFGRERVSTHYTRSEVLGIDGSPTLFINNRLYDGGGRYGDLIFDICGNNGNSDSSCLSIGECYYDYQCPVDSFVGICRKENGVGRCIKLKEDSVTLFIITPEGFSKKELELLKNQFSPLFPSLKYKMVSISSKLGDSLMSGLPPVIPKLLFDKELKNLHNFGRILPSLSKWRGYYEIIDSSFSGNYYYKRDSIPGMSVFVDVDDEALVDLLTLSREDVFKIMPKIALNPTKKQLSLLKSWLKSENCKISIENYRSEQINDSGRFHILLDNRWFYVANSVNELKEVISWLKSER